jgi:hypothetical protein
MAVGPGRYAGDLLGVAGFDLPDFDGAGYPVVTPADLAAARVDALLLTSEPHDFSDAEGREIADAVAAAGGPRPRPVLVDGQALTWFGTRTAAAIGYFRGLRETLAAQSPNS